MPFDPSIFDPEKISRETAELNKSVHDLMSSVPPTYTRPPQVIRDEREAGKGLWPVTKLDEVSERTVKALGNLDTNERQAGIYRFFRSQPGIWGF